MVASLIGSERRAGTQQAKVLPTGVLAASPFWPAGSVYWQTSHLPMTGFVTPLWGTDIESGLGGLPGFLLSRVYDHGFVAKPLWSPFPPK